MNIDDILKNTPGISPQKLAFLKAFSEIPPNSNSQSMMKHLAMCQAQAKKENIQFSDREQKILIELLTANLSKQEKARVDQILSLLNKRTGN